MNKENYMKAVYQNFAVTLMFVAVFCTLFALTLANANEVKPLAVLVALCVGFSLWFFNVADKK
jgi:FtsH-binding integral membrane protein